MSRTQPQLTCNHSRPEATTNGAPRHKRFNYTYSNTYNLTRLTPEQKAALEKKLEDPQKGEA